MSEPVRLLSYQKEPATPRTQACERVCEYKLTNKERKQLQHEIKNHVEKYVKGLLGKGSDLTRVTIWDDMVILRGEGFLTEPEKQIAKTPGGSDLIKAARMQHAGQSMHDNAAYIEAKVGAKCIHQTIQVDALKDIWIHVLIFDQVLIEQS